jgi:hypothetical protein
MPRTKANPKVRYHRILKLPPLSHEQYEGLRANVAVNGVLVPIHVDSDGPRRGIIDGIHRKQFADEFGYECPEIVHAGLEPEEKRTLARALNLARRSFDTDQKRQLIADQLEETPDRSSRWIAKMLGVTHPTVLSVRGEMESTGKALPVRTVGRDGKSRPAKYGFRAGDYAAKPKPNTISTPAGVCRFLHNLVSTKYEIRTILDPCSGTSALTRPWKCVKVIDFEISEGKDFFQCQNHIDADLVLCNPPFNSEGHTFLPQLFLERILKVVSVRTPIVLFTPMGMRLNQHKTSTRWRWLRDHCPPITSIVSLPVDVFPNVQFHSEILLFNMPKLNPHYFLPDKYLRNSD